MTTLQLLWFVIMVFLAAGYAVLDGYDLGVACWLPWAGGDRRLRTLVRAILPFWDGNEVWLLAV